MKENTELIFVYNADSGVWNAYLDTLHKTFSPNTYSCNLCAITHGAFSMKKEWAEFIKTLPVKLRFLHRDEWEKEFKRKDSLPAVFKQEGGEISTFIDAKEMNRMKLEDLMATISAKTAKIA